MAILRKALLRTYVSIFCRPLFFNAFLLLQKLSLLGMGREIAGLLKPTETGEKEAFSYAISRMWSQQNPHEQLPLIIFDVGANVGDWTQMTVDELQCRGKFRLFAFEPTVTICDQFMRDIERIRGSRCIR